MSLRILILSDAYGKPAFAPRLRYLCDYLTRKGHLVEVFTEQWDEIPFEHNYTINEIRLMKGGSWIIKSIANLLWDWKSKTFYNQVKQQTKGQTYDLVFCTTFSTFPLKTASRIAEERNIPFIADIRDLDEQIQGAQYQQHRQWYLRPFRNIYKHININRRNQALQKATAITTISPWHQSFIQQQILHNSTPVHLIYNGFDPQQFYYEPVSSSRFLITYIGKIYEFQDISILKKIIHNLSLLDAELNLHLPNHNYIPINQVGDEIRRSSIIVVLTNKKAKGMMTTKFFEALGCEKPVLCIPDDEGLLAQTIRNTNAGIATDNTDEIRQFILDKYTEWKHNGYTHQKVINKDQFNREIEAKQIEDLFRNHTAL